MGHGKDIFVDQIYKDFLCNICSDVLQNPVFIKDDVELACVACVEQGKEEEEKNHRSAPPEFLIQLQGLRVRCHLAKYGCPIITTLANLDHHLSICEYTSHCSDMDDILQHMAFLQVDDEKAVIDDVVNTARDTVPEVIESDLSDDFTEIVIHSVSLALFADFELGPIERTAEMSLSALCPEFVWKVILTVEDESECSTGTPVTPPSGSADERLHVRFGKLHAFTTRSGDLKYSESVSVEDFTGRTGPSTIECDVQVEDFE